MHDELHQLLTELEWQLAAGTSEAVAEQPVNHLTGNDFGECYPAKMASTARTPAFSAKAPFPPAPRKHPARQNVTQLAPPHAGNLLSPDQCAPKSARQHLADIKSLTELAAALQAVEHCQLKQNAKNLVFGTGNPRSQVMLIGEAPGEDEDLQGEPFVGRAGKLLDRMLKAIDLDRNQVYITNILPWRPPGNRNPTPGEIATCLPFVERHIELVQPQVLMLLGAVAVKALLGRTEPISWLRGKWLTYNTPQGMSIPVLPSFHPAYLLRSPARKRESWHDLLSLRQKLRELGLQS